MVSCETKTRLAVRRTTVTVEIFNIILFRPKGVDIVGGDINGLSTRIHDENEANVQFLKQDQNTRYVVAYFAFLLFYHCRVSDFSPREEAHAVPNWRKVFSALIKRS